MIQYRLFVDDLSLETIQDFDVRNLDFMELTCNMNKKVVITNLIYKDIVNYESSVFPFCREKYNFPMEK